MFAMERQEEILTYLKNKRSATVADLSERFFIGPASIRRDLEKLEKRNLIKRIYGGAVLLEGLNAEIPLVVREKEDASAKETIGILAARHIADNDSVIIDSSTTSHCILAHLQHKQGLTVITNGVKTAYTLSEMPYITTYCCGGKLRPNSLSLIGEKARQFVATYRVQKLFFSCRALSMEQGAQDASDDEAELRQVMIKNADQVFLLCDSSKFDTQAFCQICDWGQIDIVITETAPSEQWRIFFEQRAIELIYT